MANKKQLRILKQGAEVWYKWRDKNLYIEINLSEADLSGVNLSRVNLSGANLSEANLSGSDLITADLSHADLSHANLSHADLSHTDLSDARLTKTVLTHADLTKTVLTHANLTNADLIRANLYLVNLTGANLNNTKLGDTNVSKIDLRQANRLENIKHEYPSSINTNTLQFSKGEIPEVFLRGCGLSDWEIESAKLYKPGLSNQEINNIIYKIFDLRANQAIQISPLFISYSHDDAPFVEKLEPRLTNNGIRFWRDTHDMKSGRMEKQVDRAMRQNPTVILILSENSTRSDWVEHEARLARELEKEIGRDVLCPIALDDSWKSAKWPARLMEQIKEYNILDYSKWNDDKAFGQVFNKMISGLDMFYKPEAK